MQAIANDISQVKNDVAPEIMKKQQIILMTSRFSECESKFCLICQWMSFLSWFKNMRFSTQWNELIWISQCFQNQNQKKTSMMDVHGVPTKYTSGK